MERENPKSKTNFKPEQSKKVTFCIPKSRVPTSFSTLLFECGQSNRYGVTQSLVINLFSCPYCSFVYLCDIMLTNQVSNSTKNLPWKKSYNHAEQGTSTGVERRKERRKCGSERPDCYTITQLKWFIFIMFH